MPDATVHITPGPKLVVGEPRWWQVVEATLPLDPPVRLPPGGLSIVHLTDLHLRRATPGRRLIEWLVPYLQADPPDLLLFTGDFCDDKFAAGRQAHLAEAVVRATAPLAKAGAFGINGNHDGDLVAARLVSAGLTSVEEEVARVEVRGAPVDVAGLAGACRGGLGALEGRERDPAAPLIALGHYPDEICQCDRLRPDVYFAGHTHGGQIALPRRPIITHDGLPKTMASGVHRFEHANGSGTWLVVSRGVGTTKIPVRLFAPPEVVRVRCTN